VVGVDYREIHRDLTYGTILVDHLPDRLSAGLAVWLKAHAGADVIARDRGKP
jgi:hypothetical protein